MAQSIRKKKKKRCTSPLVNTFCQLGLIVNIRHRWFFVLYIGNKATRIIKIPCILQVYVKSLSNQQQ